MKRAYDPAAPSDGRRVLVDRVWPRGIGKEALQVASWEKEVAPSTALRKWFAHDPARWEDFKRRYFAELDARPEAVAPLLDGPETTVTLVFSARDREHNNAVALKEYLERRHL